MTSSSGITIYTDGAARGNPGPGGYGVLLMSGDHRKELSQGYKHTTNNRMELMAVIAGLEGIEERRDECYNLFRQPVCSKSGGRRLVEYLDKNKF